MLDDSLNETEKIKIQKKLVESLQNYRKTMSYMVGDAPIGVLCLPKSVEKALVNSGLLRVYDLFDRDLTKIKGVGKVGVGHLTSSLHEFLSMR